MRTIECVERTVAYPQAVGKVTVTIMREDGKFIKAWDEQGFTCRQYLGIETIFYAVPPSQGRLEP